MNIEISEYITANTYKALLFICNRDEINFENLIPYLKLCQTDDSLIFYRNDIVILQVINRKYYTNEMVEIDISGTKTSALRKMMYYATMRKRQKNVVLITFK
jgi:hypothetical protein